MALSKAQILAAADHKVEPVDVPEWGGTLYIRTLSARERDRFEGRVKMNPFEDLRAHLAVASVCDEGGNPLFGLEDVPALTVKNGSVLDRIFDAAIKLNRLSKKEVEELKKNS